MIGLVVTNETTLRADAADRVGTVLNDIHQELQGTQYLFLVDDVCNKHGVQFIPAPRR